MYDIQIYMHGIDEFLCMMLMKTTAQIEMDNVTVLKTNQAGSWLKRRFRTWIWNHIQIPAGFHGYYWMTLMSLNTSRTQKQQLCLDSLDFDSTF